MPDDSHWWEDSLCNTLGESTFSGASLTGSKGGIGGVLWQSPPLALRSGVRPPAQKACGSGFPSVLGCPPEAAISNYRGPIPPR
jgi:hypothetical protein